MLSPLWRSRSLAASLRLSAVGHTTTRRTSPGAPPCAVCASLHPSSSLPDSPWQLPSYLACPPACCSARRSSSSTSSSRSASPRFTTLFCGCRFLIECPANTVTRIENTVNSQGHFGALWVPNQGFLSNNVSGVQEDGEEEIRTRRRMSPPKVKSAAEARKAPSPASPSILSCLSCFRDDLLRCSEFSLLAFPSPKSVVQLERHFFPEWALL